MQSEGLIAAANPAATAEDARIGRDGADAAESLAGPGSHGVAETLRQIAGIGRRNLRPMLGIVALALVAAAVLTLLTTRAYTAIASVQVNDQSAQVLGKAFEGENEAIPASDTERFLNTQLEILNSRGIAQRVARRLGLERDAKFQAATGVDPTEAGDSPAARQDAVIAALRDRMHADLPRNTRIVRIGFASQDPALSARIANAYADEFIQANLQRRFEAAAYARDFIAQRLDEARARLENSERELNAYARGAGLIRARDAAQEGTEHGPAASVTSSSLMQVNQAANQAAATRSAAEGRWLAEQATPLLASQAVLANPTVQALMTQRAQLRAALEATRQRYLGDHPKIQEAQAELREVQQQLDLVASGVRNSIRADYLAALSAEGRLRDRVRALKGETLAEQDRSVRYNTLAREADTNRSIYDGLLQRYRELNASAGISASNLAIIDRADPPLLPSSPNLKLNLMLGLLAGIAIAAIAAVLRDQLDDTVRTADDIGGKLGLPLLGLIPDGGQEDALAALSRPSSPLAEAYGSLRGVLLYSSRAGLPRLMQVTSAQPTEGKSTTAYALASGFARQGRAVLLIDADLRRPTLHRALTRENRRGLSSLLVSADPLASALQPSVEPGLDLLPSGPLPPSPTELLTSPRMAALLEECAASYDVVVIDSPPVLGLADAPALAALADGVVFVVEADRARRGALKSALRRLKAVDAVILGAALTKFDAAKSGAAYYGADYYRYAPDESAAAA